MLQSCIALNHELRLLDYTHYTILSAVIKANRSRPDPVWKTVHNLIHQQSLRS
jgi:hypothetical protein